MQKGSNPEPAEESGKGKGTDFIKEIEILNNTIQHELFGRTYRFG